MRLIDADRLKRQVEGRSWRAKGKMVELIDNSPTIEAEHVKHGRWQDGRCSICKEDEPHTENGVWTETAYCPNCGAKMDKEGEE